MLTVNGQIVEPSAIDEEFNRLRPHYERYVQQQGKTSDANQLREWARETIIERVLLEQEAKKIQLPDTNKDGGKNVFQRQMQQLIESINKDIEPPTDDELADIYRSNKAQYSTPEQVHVAHIVKHTQGGASDPLIYGEMLNIRERIRKGESFEQLASQLSDCSDRAGDLGFFPRGQMVQTFEDIVFNMNEGDVSEVFQTEFGYHIAKLYEKKEASALPLEDVRDQLRSQILDSRHEKARQEYIASLKQSAEIRDVEA